MRYEQPQCELLSSRDKGLRNYETWAGHKNLIDLAMERYLQKPCDATLEHLEQSLKIYRNGYERCSFRPPTGALYKADNKPPEAYQFR